MASVAPVKPRLLYLVHQFGHQTGVELHVRLLGDALADRYDVSVAWPEEASLHLLHEGQQHSFVADAISWPQAPERAERSERALTRIGRLVQPDLIHIQHFLNWPLSVIDQAVDMNVPVVVSFHDHFALSPLYALPPDEGLSAAWSIRTFGRDISAWLQVRRERLHRSLARVDQLVTVSPYLEQQLAAVFPLEYRQIEYGIVDFEPLPKRPSAALRFGFLGQLVPMKGWQSLVQAFAEVRRRHAGVELHLWGGTQDEPPPGVSFHGAYTAADLPAICACVDVGVVPSIFAETYCMVLSEMWQGGLPVAVSDIGAMRDRVTEGVNGWRFTPGDAASLAARLCWFAENDAWRSWRLPRPRLVDAMVADYDSLYQQLLIAPARRAVATPATNVQEGPATAVHTSPADAELLIVQVCGFLVEGDGVYRLHSPSQALSRVPGITVIECHPYHRHLPELAEAADVLILASLDWDVFGLIPRRRAAGRITIFEANDYYPDIQPWNPLSTQWLDRSLHDWLRHSLQQADGVQTSTPELARRWRERTDRPVAVFPNQLPQVPPLRAVPARPLTIGWGGSRGHLRDWQRLAPALQAWLDAHSDVHLAVMTDARARPFLRLRPDRYHFQTLGSLADYLQFLDRLDIGLAPLLPTDFNRCRSDVKFLEYASRGVAGVYASLEPYRDSIVHGRNGFLYRTEAELFEALDALVADVGLRQRIRQEAYTQVARQRRLEDHIETRATFYRTLLGASKADRPHLSAALRASLERQGRHVQLRPEEPEEILEAVLEAPARDASVAAVERLLQTYPDYLAARQHLGAVYNDRRQPRAALPHLEHAHRLAPDRAWTLCELGRACHSLGDSEQAQRWLEKAIELNPYAPLPWRYLLRLLHTRAARAGRGGDDRLWAERARALHPANYALALLGVPLYPPAEALTLLDRLLDEHTATLHPAERATAAAAFAAAIAEVTGPLLERPEACRVVQRAHAIFPRSARLAELAARIRVQESRPH